MGDKETKLCALLLRVASPVTHDNAPIAQINQASEVVHNLRLGTCAGISAAVRACPGFSDQDQPTIAIEFVSASKRDFQRDYIDKRDEYLRAGVLEYWIIDRFRRRMTVVRGGSDPVTEIVITEQETYTTPLLPGFALPLAQLLAVADAVEAAQRR